MVVSKDGTRVEYGTLSHLAHRPSDISDPKTRARTAAVRTKNTPSVINSYLSVANKLTDLSSFQLSVLVLRRNGWQGSVACLDRVSIPRQSRGL